MEEIDWTLYRTLLSLPLDLDSLKLKNISTPTLGGGGIYFCKKERKPFHLYLALTSLLGLSSRLFLAG